VTVAVTSVQAGNELARRDVPPASVVPVRPSSTAEGMRTVTSWGRIGRGPHFVARPAFRDEALAALQGGPVPCLCYGLGRSYGDVCLNENGRLIVTDMLDHFIAFDRESGVVRAEAGLSLDALLRVVVPHGWFPQVVPGTKFVTLGGAVANDVHGKNHELAGTFGRHVRSLGLARSSGEISTLSREENAELFAATVGGLGLTGMIVWVELQLMPIRSSFIETERLPIADLDAFFELAGESGDWTYTVAWVDCLAEGGQTGRGLFIRGRHAETGGFPLHRSGGPAVPLDAPGMLLNSQTIGLFNTVYRARPWATGKKRMHYDPFFFPLDRIGQWNRLYGRRGFFQHQSAVPLAVAPTALRKLLELTSQHGQGSFLVVLKLFGNEPSPGVLSFPLPGATLALDFPNKGASTLDLLRRMTEVVLEAGGRIYPAKDATMSGAAFRAGYPDWRKVEGRRDPAIMSDFWRRVTADAA
jgi:FAD/FMN-containing dehydrogenase